MTLHPDSRVLSPRHRHRRFLPLVLAGLLAVIAFPGSPVRAGRSNPDPADSLRREIDRRLARIATLRDSLAALRGATDTAAGAGTELQSLQEVVDRIQQQVKDLELQIDDSSILLAGPSARLRIDLPEDWGRKVGQSLQSLLEEIPMDTLQQGIQELRQQAREMARELTRRRQHHRKHWETVGEDWVRFGEDVNLAAGERLTGDLVVLFGDAVVAGRVDGNVVVIGGNLTLKEDAQVGEDAVAVLGRLTVSPGARVDGDTVDLGPFGHRVWERGGEEIATPVVGIAAQVALLVAVLLLAWLVLVIVPRERLQAVEHQLGESPGAVIGVGVLWTLLGHLLLLVVLAVLLLSIVGIPLALLLMLLYVVFGLLALAVVGRRVGRALCRQACRDPGGASWMVLPGLLLLLLPWLFSWPFQWWHLPVPVTLLVSLTLLVLVATYVLGSGAILRSRFGSR